MDLLHEEDNNPFSSTSSHLFSSTISNSDNNNNNNNNNFEEVSHIQNDSTTFHGSILNTVGNNSILFHEENEEDDNNPHHYGYPSFHHMTTHMESSASVFSDSLPHTSIHNEQENYLSQSDLFKNKDSTDQSIHYEYGDTNTTDSLTNSSDHGFTKLSLDQIENPENNSSNGSVVILNSPSIVPTGETSSSYNNNNHIMDEEDNTRIDYEGLLKNSRYSKEQLEDDEDYGEIYISEAGQMKDNNGSTVVMYVIKYHSTLIRRRYSEFDHLRTSLRKLFPTVILPPIPEKHSMVTYFLNPINARNDLKIINKRKRLLSVFLQGCLSVKVIRNSKLWSYFMNPNMTWNDIASSPPISILPASNLLAPPLDPVKPSPLHLLLPLPQSTNISNTFHTPGEGEIDAKFKDYHQIFKLYKIETYKLEKLCKKQKRHFKTLTKDLGELGAFYNAFSLEDHDKLSTAIEKTGQAIDINFINSETFTFQILTILEEPMFEFNQMSSEALNVFKFRRLKEIQYHIIYMTINKRQTRIKELNSAQEQSKRLEEILRQNASQSPTIAAAVKRLEQGENLNMLRRNGVNSSTTWKRLFSGGNNNSRTNASQSEITTMTEQERKEEVVKLEAELIKLNDCLRVITKDLKEINKSLSNNVETLLSGFNEQWKLIMRKFTSCMLEYLRENKEAWIEAKKEIEDVL